MKWNEIDLHYTETLDERLNTIVSELVEKYRHSEDKNFYELIDEVDRHPYCTYRHGFNVLHQVISRIGASWRDFMVHHTDGKSDFKCYRDVFHKVFRDGERHAKARSKVATNSEDSIMKFFEYAHLPEKLQKIGQPGGQAIIHNGGRHE